MAFLENASAIDMVRFLFIFVYLFRSLSFRVQMNNIISKNFQKVLPGRWRGASRGWPAVDALYKWRIKGIEGA